MKITLKNPSIVTTLIALSLLSGCSVYKAASNDGIVVPEIRDCTTKGCFLSHGMDIIDKHQEEDGQYTETYRAKARKSGLNYVRAAGHGILDVATIGLWEVVGTPVEGSLSNNRGYITVKATYTKKESDQLTKLVIYDAYGKEVKSSK